jgi:hypothetical protein
MQYDINFWCGITLWPAICPLWLHHNNQPAMTEPSSPSVPVYVTAASQSVAASPNSLSTSSSNRNNNEEEEAPLSTYYCRVYLESEKAGSNDLHVLFANYLTVSKWKQ